MPKQYTRKAKQKINRQVYELIFKNPAIFDGAPLFDAAHKNLIETGSAPGITVLEKMIEKMGLQTDQFGESIMVEPATIIVPVGYGMRVEQILGTAQIDVEGIGTHTPRPWVMASDPRLVKSVQVDYLNGTTAPSFRRSEKAGYLGYLWDIWLDWGINAADFRGILRNNGVPMGQ